MNRLRSWLWRLSSYLRAHRLEHEMEDELRFHLEMETQENLRRGLTAGEARRLAAIRLGGVEQIKEAYRGQRGLPRLEDIVRDLRLALRSLKGSPGFTLTVLLVTTIAIGANTAIFSVVNAVLLAPLPYSEPDRLMQIVLDYQGTIQDGLSGLELSFLKENVRSLNPIAASGSGAGGNLVYGRRAEYIRVRPVSAEFVPLLGIAPSYGRGFTVEEDRQGGPQAILLSQGLWQRSFQSDIAVLGEAVRLGGEPHTVVGIMPEGFQTVPAVDAWIPLRADSNFQGAGYNYTTLGRLTPGTTREQAQQELRVLTQAFGEQHADSNTVAQGGMLSALPYQGRLASNIRPALLLLLGAVGLVLLIGCANISSLMMARASTRRQEIAIRLALGGRPGRIVRALLTESLLLSLAGGVLGLLATLWGIRSLMAMAPAGLVPAREVSVDANVLLFTFGASLLTGVLFGLFPAWQGSRLDVASTLQESSRRTTGDSSVRLRQSLVVAEMAICLVLLVGSALLVLTFSNLLNVELGFDAQNILTGQMSMEGTRSGDSQALTAFYDQALERIRQLPGVQGAAVSNNLPVERGLNLPFEIETAEGKQFQAVDWRYVSADYFRVMGIPLKQGRPLGATETRASLPVAVVNQEFARRYYPEADILTKSIVLYPFTPSIEARPWQIVGVVGNVKSRSLSTPAIPTIYMAMDQIPAPLFQIAHTYFPMNWIVRTSSSGVDAASIQEIVRSLDPTQPFAGFRTMDQVMRGSVRQQRFQMVLLSAFALAALAMAVTGIYGLISYLVAQRQREIGIRMALGASRGTILGRVMKRAAALTATGAVLGGLASLALAQLMSQFLFNVSATDPTILTTVALVLIASSSLAAFIPGVRALRSDSIVDLLEK